MRKITGVGSLPMPFIDRRGFLIGAAATGATLASGSRLARAASDTLVMGLVNYPPNLKPLENSGSSQGAVKLAIYRSLLSYDPEGKLQNELAESWTQDGPTVHVFKLRDAKFHNGAPVTAEDVAWTIGLVKDPKSAAFLRAD